MDSRAGIYRCREPGTVNGRTDSFIRATLVDSYVESDLTRDRSDIINTRDHVRNSYFAFPSVLESLAPEALAKICFSPGSAVRSMEGPTANSFSRPFPAPVSRYNTP